MDRSRCACQVRSHWTRTIGRLPPAPLLGRIGIALAIALLAILLLPPIVPYRSVWEIAAALGYAACLAAIMTFRIAPSPATATSNRRRWTLHRAAGYAMMALVALHAAVMLLGDPFAIDYIGWMMPRHVLAGVLAALALLLAVVTREPRLRAALPTARWPRLHVSAGIAAIALAGAHVFTSAGKFADDWRYAVLAGIVGALLVPALLTVARGPRRWPRPMGRRRPRRTAARPAGPPANAGVGGVVLLLAGLTAATLLLITVPTLVRLIRG